jgi:hypothetical protein
MVGRRIITTRRQALKSARPTMTAASCPSHPAEILAFMSTPRLKHGRISRDRSRRCLGNSGTSRRLKYLGRADRLCPTSNDALAPTGDSCNSTVSSGRTPSQDGYMNSADNCSKSASGLVSRVLPIHTAVPAHPRGKAPRGDEASVGQFDCGSRAV